MKHIMDYGQQLFRRLYMIVKHKVRFDFNLLIGESVYLMMISSIICCRWIVL